MKKAGSSNNPTDIYFKIPKEQLPDPILEHGTLKVDLSPAFFQAWTLGGMVKDKIDVLATSLKINGDNAYIKNVRLVQDRLYNLCLTYVPEVNVFKTAGAIYSIDVVQKSDGKIIGGERFEYSIPAQEGLIPTLKQNSEAHTGLNQTIYAMQDKIVLIEDSKAISSKKFSIFSSLGQKIYESSYTDQLEYLYSNLPGGYYVGKIEEISTGKIQSFQFIVVK